MIVNRYPYTDQHELNLDWILKKIKELGIQIDEFEHFNEITFGGTWDISKQYQAWTIVVDNNKGYISVKPVPSNTLLTNTEYWEQIVDFNKPLLDRKIIFMSDSYGYHPTVDTSWISDVVNKLGLESYEFYSWYEGSMGAIHVGGAGHTYLTLAQAKASDVLNPEEITDIILCAGTNDAYYAADYSQTALLNALRDYFSYMHETYPNAKIHAGACGNFIGKDVKQTEYIAAMSWLYAKAAADFGGTYIDNIQYIMHSYRMFDDSQHPNTYGAEEIANAVVSHLSGGNYNFFDETTDIFRPYTGNTINANNRFNVVTINDITTIRFTPSSFTLGTPVTTPVDVPLMRFDPRKFGCPLSPLTCITGELMQGFNTPIPIEYTFEIDDPDSSTGGIVKLNSTVSSDPISTGGLPYIGCSIATILF